MSSKSGTPETKCAPSKQRYTGRIKQLDSHGCGSLHSFCLIGQIPFTSSSLSDPTQTRTISAGDRVEFSLAPIDVVPTGPQCYFCGRVGHYVSECPNETDSRDCSSNGDSERPNSSGGGDRKGVGSVVCVKDRKDVQRVERFEDCFILDFDPHDDDDDDEDDDDEDEEEDDDDEDEDEDDEDEDEDDDDDEDEDDVEDVTSIVCVKNPEEVKKVEEVEDCFILEFDPTETIDFSNLSLSEKSVSVSADEEVSILAEKGQVACRDYPHPRHACAIHPFKTTSHELHCKMCYCYVCDIPAPCKDWTDKIVFSHCEATADVRLWRDRRDQKKKEKQVKRLIDNYCIGQ